MFKSDRLFVIGSRNGRVARVGYNPRTGANRSKATGEVDNAGDVAALQLVNYTIGQLIEQGFKGKVTIVTHDDIAVRGFEFRKAVNAGHDPLTALSKDWMDEEYLGMIEEFCSAMSETSADVGFMKMKNIRYWDIKVADEFVAVDETNKELVGTQLEFVDGVSGVYVAQTKLNGKFTVTTHHERLNGERVECLSLERAAVNANLINLRKAEDAVWNACPVPEVDFDNVEESEAI